jgi:hypothetical protein
VKGLRPFDWPPKITAVRGFKDPVEEVRLHRSHDAAFGERAAAQQIVRLGQLDTEHADRHRLRHDCEVCVLKEEVVGVHGRTVHVLEKAGPQFAREPDLFDAGEL